jgi:hypothetical protein
MDMLRYTKFSLENAAISLVPIFPIWTLFPGVLLAGFFEYVQGDCETGYKIVLWLCIVMIVPLIWWYLHQIPLWINYKKRRALEQHFRLFSLGIYTLSNIAIFIIMLGTDLACHGDGQTILAAIVSGPLASIGLIVLGFLVDLKKGDQPIN